MVKFTRPLMVALIVSVAVLAGCGTTPTSASPRTPAPPAGRGRPADMATTFNNSVPEAPWWDKAAPPSKWSAAARLSWTLSGDILFDSGSATLSASALSQLSGIIAAAQSHCHATVVVLGYTDNLPDPSFPGGNQGLSTARAAVVAHIIEAAKIPGDHVAASGEGASNPVGDNGTSAGRQMNRRVVIRLSAPAASCPFS